MDVTGMLGTFTQMRARMNSLSQMLKAGGAQGARLRSPAVSSAPIAASASSAATDNVIFQHGVCMHTSAFKCPCCTSLLPAECACRCRACHPCTIQSAAGRVAKGKVRRKRVGGRRGLAELSKLHA